MCYSFVCFYLFQIQAQYSQGTWVGKLVSDYVHFPSMVNVPEVRSDIALITKSHKFFMNGSGWQVSYVTVINLNFSIHTSYSPLVEIES